MLLNCKITVVFTLTFAELPKSFSEYYRIRHFIAIIGMTVILDNSYSWRRPNAQRSGEWNCLRLQAVEIVLFVP